MKQVLHEPPPAKLRWRVPDLSTKVAALRIRPPPSRSIPRLGHRTHLALNGKVSRTASVPTSESVKQLQVLLPSLNLSTSRTKRGEFSELLNLLLEDRLQTANNLVHIAHLLSDAVSADEFCSRHPGLLVAEKVPVLNLTCRQKADLDVFLHIALQDATNIYNPFARVESLRFSHGKLGMEDVTKLLALLQATPRLQAMEVASCRIAREGWKVLEEGIADRELASVRVKGDGKSRGENVALAMGALASGETETLALDFLGLSSPDLVRMSKIVAAHPKLRALELHTNKIGNKGGAALGKALQRNKSLEVLVLDNNKIDCRGIHGLAMGLARNRSLKKLTLRGNPVGREGMNVLAKVCKQHASLQTLDVEESKIKGIPEWEVSVFKRLRVRETGSK
ncbi:hypothetical protein CYMTET_53113 [Cymbomonas tetramitiformis]|uniref:Uncharacterized protein n=1 Tax=Cymbomonas tetramitiformis TaxID=36881 RepID=A0AAE0BHW5_9CHLO|nr:hypothetical protein CYMTET_53113 [Cymbomonas tetramitiformis]